MFSLFKKRHLQDNEVKRSPMDQAILWRDSHNGLLAPDWLFEAEGYALGSMYATMADTLSRIVLKEVKTPKVQRILSDLPADKAKAAVALYAHGFVYRGFTLFYTHKLEIDNETHETAEFIARYVHELTGDPYSGAIGTLGKDDACTIITAGGNDGLDAVLCILKKKELPPMSLVGALRNLKDCAS